MHSPLLDRIAQLGPLTFAVALLVATVLSHLPISSGPPSAAAIDPGRPAPATLPGASVADFGEMPGWHLFGVEAADMALESIAPEPSIADLPPASVDLRLNGIAYATDSRRTYAIIATADGAQKKYRSGEAVTPEVTIQTIDRQQVVIAHQGRLESLRLPVESLPRDPNLPVPAGTQNPSLSQMRLIPPARALPRPPKILPAFQLPLPVPPPNANQAFEANQ